MTQTLTDPEPQAVETPDGEVAAILARTVQYTDAGLIIADDLTFDDWSKGVDFYQHLRTKTSWIVGDFIRYGEKYGEKYAQAIDLGKSESRLQSYVSVCGRFSLDRRNPRLSFDMHEACAYIDPREADALLIRAERERWRREDMRAEVAKINERNGVPKRGRKSSGTAAKVAASGKTPELVEAPEVAPATKLGLFWNGHLLATSERLIYQADERLDALEADRAAHHHGFAHAEALVNWLEQNGFIRKEGETQCDPKTTTNQNPDTEPALQIESASVVQPDAAPNSAQPASPAPASTPSEALVSPETLKAISALSEASSSAYPMCDKNANHGRMEFFGYIGSGSNDGTPGEDWRCPACEITRLTTERDDAREQLKRFVVFSDMRTPLELAEEHILAFNAASEKVDWPAVGKSALARKKWLGRLLAPADNAIDAIQGTPPTPRK